jgi:hypothetical protein
MYFLIGGQKTTILSFGCVKKDISLHEESTQDHALKKARVNGREKERERREREKEGGRERERERELEERRK